MGKLGINAPTMGFVYLVGLGYLFIYFFATSDLEQKMMDNCNKLSVKRKFKLWVFWELHKFKFNLEWFGNSS